MRILVYPHELGMGGSQINAVELAGAVRDLGHDVFVFATRGVLLDKVQDLRLPFIEAPPRKNAVDFQTMRILNETVRELNIDLVHPYEWTSIVNTAFGPALRYGTPAVMTVLSMDVPDFLPRYIPIIVGTHGLARDEAARRGNIHVIEPPIDAQLNKTTGMHSARERLGLSDADLVVSIVGRLTNDLGKLDGVKSAIRVTDRISDRLPVTLLVAGSGEGSAEVEAMARAVNNRHGRAVVRLEGNVLDPRPIYDAADVVLGMGSSALRGMAYAKPVIVQGESGYWRIASPETERQFLDEGWFGRGGQGDADLEPVLATLISDPALRTALGTFGRSLVEERFGLAGAADQVVSIYRNQLQAPPTTIARTRSLVRSGYEVAKFRFVVQLRGRSTPKPVAGG